MILLKNKIASITISSLFIFSAQAMQSNMPRVIVKEIENKAGIPVQFGRLDEVIATIDQQNQRYSTNIELEYLEDTLVSIHPREVLKSYRTLFLRNNTGARLFAHLNTHFSQDLKNAEVILAFDNEEGLLTGRSKRNKVSHDRAIAALAIKVVLQGKDLEESSLVATIE